MLFRKQRNDLFTIIVDNNLLPGDFKESPDAGGRYSITFKDPRFYFNIYDSSELFKAYYEPANYGPNSGNEGIDKWYSWEGALFYFKKWIAIVREEFETPDLWAEAQSNAHLFASSSATPNEMFSDSELRALQGQIRQVEQGITALGLPAHAEKALLESIKEAPEKATRFTKKEWQSWFIGAVVAQVTNLALSAEHVAAVAQLLKSTFMGLLQLH
jgi:hypothetical protein